MQEVSLDELKEIITNSKDNLTTDANSLSRNVCVYLHWSAGHYNQYYEDYHINISKEGKYFVSTDDLSEVLAHTWKRNTGAIGIALACCAGATSNDLGDEPPTSEQIEAIALLTAWICKIIEIPCDVKHIMTHGEAADNEDGYFGAYGEDEEYGPKHTCERWDLEYLGTNESPRYNPYATDGSRGGDILRGKINFYLNLITG